MGNWLSELKPGDTVVVESRNRTRISKVKRITPTGRIVVDDCQFRPNSGEMYGGGMYDHTKIVEATPERLNEISMLSKRSKLLKEIQSCVLTDLSLESLEKIYEIINKDPMYVRK